MTAGSESGITPENRLTGAYLIVALIALFGGVVTGLFQGMNYGGHDVYPALQPVIKSYYHGLSIHGVLNVLVWTTFFICGFLQFITARALGAPLAVRALGWPVFWLMTGGLILAAIPLVLNEATVLFTFYPPLQAHWAFYIGLTLVVAGTWLVMVNLAMSVGVWKRGHPGQRTPLPAFMSLVTFVMWTMASLGIAAEMLFMMIPWSLGLIPGTNPLMARTLFWFSGHPIVYFWLLPVYVSWYTIIPRQAGGRLFSDPMARASFLLFLLLSTPVGFHHQFTDPGIGEDWKFFHAFLTFGVFFPSLLTFFNVVSSLESGARAHGGKGYFAWFLKLPWGNPSLAAQVFAMLLFCFGGIGGLINASAAMNLSVHNTAWIVGHFHLTVGAAVTLSFMGITYWLVPVLSGRRLWSRGLALAQAWLWFGGMIVFSNTLHRLGTMGMPRRTMMSAVPYMQPEWKALLPLVGIGGAILFLSAMLYFLNLAMTAWASPASAEERLEFAEAASGPEDAPAFMDRLVPWVAASAVLIVLAYAPTIYRLATETPFNIQAFRVW
jgi:cytochrome c oxidase subunit 1